MRRLSAFGSLGFLVLALPTFGGGDGEKPKDSKEALQALQEYIGGWKGNGTADKDKSLIWKETVNWSWRFKGKDVSFTVDMADSKHFKKGELRYLKDKDAFQLTLLDKKDKEQVFEGEMKKGYLTLERADPETREGQQIKINTAGGGLRLVLTYATRLPDRKIFNKQFQIAYTKEGESFGTSAKKPECIVTGGLGTMAVSFMGASYYVCCSGCRDAFNENPAKIVADYLARKKAGK